MAGCGCGSSFSFNPGAGIDEQSNASGVATWANDLTTELPPQGISGRSPYGEPPTFFTGFKFCRKCFATWVVVFLVVAFLFVRYRD